MSLSLIGMGTHSMVSRRRSKQGKTYVKRRLSTELQKLLLELDLCTDVSLHGRDYGFDRLARLIVIQNGLCSNL